MIVARLVLMFPFFPGLCQFRSVTALPTLLMVPLIPARTYFRLTGKPGKNLFAMGTNKACPILKICPIVKHCCRFRLVYSWDVFAEFVLFSEQYACMGICGVFTPTWGALGRRVSAHVSTSNFSSWNSISVKRNFPIFG